MSTAEEKKKFVIKHVFNDVSSLPLYNCYDGQEERHHNIPWKFQMYNDETYCDVGFECLKFRGTDDWSINGSIEVKLQTKTGKEVFVKDFKFSGEDSEIMLKEKIPFETHLVNDNLSIECHVTINKTTGFDLKMRNFDESMKEFSDVVLIVENEKFYVSKLLLAAHSSYFKALFFGNFLESKQTEVELKDIDAWYFQNFLEVLYGEPAVNDYTVEGILRLADMYDAKTAIRRCEKFLLLLSEQALKFKFSSAVKYGMEKLKKKCITEIVTVNDVASAMPTNAHDIDQSVWQEMFNICVDLHNQKMKSLSLI